MWDIENRKYLDFTAGIAVNALGHCDEGMSTVIAEQVGLSPSFPSEANTESPSTNEYKNRLVN